MQATPRSRAFDSAMSTQFVQFPMVRHLRQWYLRLFVLKDTTSSAATLADGCCPEPRARRGMKRHAPRSPTSARRSMARLPKSADHCQTVASGRTALGLVPRARNTGRFRLPAQVHQQRDHPGVSCCHMRRRANSLRCCLGMHVSTELVDPMRRRLLPWRRRQPEKCSEAGESNNRTRRQRCWRSCPS